MSKPLYDPSTTVSAQFEDLIDIVPGATVSKALIDAHGVRQILFAMDADQELTEHTSPALAIVQVITGKLWIRVGKDEHNIAQGAWVLMPSNIPHAVKATEKSRWLLTMIKPRE